MEKAGLWIEGIVGEFWSKPLFTCPTCMGGIYSIVAFPFFFHQYDIRILATVPVTICLATLISSLIDIVNVLRDIKDELPNNPVKAKRKK